MDGWAPWLMSAHRERTLCWILTLLGLVAASVLVLSFAFTPEEVVAGAIQEAFGVTHNDCPGCAFCGLSRAFSSASHGDWMTALELNRLFLPAYGLIWLMALCIPVAVGRIFRPMKFSEKDK